MNRSLIKKSLEKEKIYPKSIKFFDVGTSKSSYIIETKDGKFVLKLFKKKKEKFLRNQMRIMKKINSRRIVTIKPAHSRIILLGSKIGYAYRFVEGKPYRELNIKNKLNGFGKIVGRFNRLGRNILPKRKTSNYITKEVNDAKETLKYLEGKERPLEKKSKKLLEKGLELYGKEKLPKKFRIQLIHGDLHDNNVLVENKNNIIIDLDGLSNSMLLREISTSCSYLASNSMDNYKKCLKAFLSGYEAEYKLTRKEKELIPIFMILRKFGEIIYLIKQEQEKTLSEKEIKHFLGHTTRKLEIIIRNYSQIKKIFKSL